MIIRPVSALLKDENKHQLKPEKFNWVDGYPQLPIHTGEDDKDSALLDEGDDSEDEGPYVIPTNELHTIPLEDKKRNNELTLKQLHVINDDDDDEFNKQLEQGDKDVAALEKFVAFPTKSPWPDEQKVISPNQTNESKEIQNPEEYSHFSKSHFFNKKKHKKTDEPRYSSVVNIYKSHGLSLDSLNDDDDEAQTESYYGQVVEEVGLIASDMFKTIGDVLPENNYWAGSFYTIVIPFLLQEIRIAFTLPQHPSIGPWWNYLDAMCSVFVGCVQLADNTSHRPNATGFKGLVNILSGLQLSTLTFLSFTAFGGPGFAAAFFACFVLSMDETVRSYRRVHDREYWMKDSIAELLKLEELEAKLSLDYEKMLEVNVNFDSKNIKDRLTNWTLERQEKRLAEYRSKIDKLIKDITVRAKIMRCNGGDPSFSFLDGYCNQTRNEANKKKIDVLSKHLADLDPSFKLQREFKKPEGDSVIKADQRIQKECEDQFFNNAQDTAALFFAFAGMLLICFPFPATQLIGMACIGIASIYFLAKNADKLADKAVSVAKYVGSFFSSENKGPKEKKQQSLESLAEKRRELAAATI